MSEEYSGLVGAFPYAVRRSDSRLFRAYAVLGGLLAAALAVVFALALIRAIAATATLQGGTVTFVRSIFVVFGFLVVAPIVAPVLFVARRHRREGSDGRYDTAMAVSGVVYVFTVFLGGVASMPPAFRSDVSGPAGPFVEALYAVPESLSWVLPLAGAVGVSLVHRRFR
jgi:heme/copper-type cytochrome/quinol oxidase subunit 4